MESNRSQQTIESNFIIDEFVNGQRKRDCLANDFET